MKHHAKSKPLKIAELFAFFDEKKTGKIDEASFVKVLPTLDVEAGTEKPWCSPEDLPRVFSHMVEQNQGYISKEEFEQMMTVYMKVTKECALTDVLGIKTSATVRRVDAGEVMEVGESPEKDESTGLMRVRVRAIKDSAEGWLTVQGNNGTIFLEEGGGLFKVVQETILTQDFDIGSATMALKDTTRKLKPGEVLEVREWPKKEKESDLLRMKCRVKGPRGNVGWATTQSSTGAVFLKPL